MNPSSSNSKLSLIYWLCVFANLKIQTHAWLIQLTRPQANKARCGCENTSHKGVEISATNVAELAHSLSHAHTHTCITNIWQESNKACLPRIEKFASPGFITLFQGSPSTKTTTNYFFKYLKCNIHSGWLVLRGNMKVLVWKCHFLKGHLLVRFFEQASLVLMLFWSIIWCGFNCNNRLGEELKENLDTQQLTNKHTYYYDGQE